MSCKRKEPSTKRKMKKKRNAKQPKAEHYQCLTGETVKRHPEEKCVTIAADTVAFLICPITMEYAKIPVVFDGKVYEEDALRRWFLTSLVHPLHGTKVATDVLQLIRVPIWRFLLLSLSHPEKHRSSLLFHSTPISYPLAELLGRLFLPGVTRKEVNQVRSEKKSLQWSVGNSNEIYLSRMMFDPIWSQEEKSAPYLEATQLLQCPLSGRVPNKVNAQGSLLWWPDTIPIWSPSAIRSESIEQHICSFKSAKCLLGEEKKTNNLSSQLLAFYHFNQKDEDEEQGGDYFTSAATFHKQVDKLGASLFPSFQLLPYVFRHLLQRDDPVQSIPCRSPQEVIRERLEKMRNYMKENKLEHGWKTLSAAWDGKFAGCGQTSNLQTTRKSLALPFLVKPSANIYGEDFSFMTLASKVFGGPRKAPVVGCRWGKMPSEANLSLKDYQFSGCDLSQTIWTGVDFSCCTFVDANLSGATFIECQFFECVGITQAEAYEKECTVCKCIFD